MNDGAVDDGSRILSAHLLPDETTLRTNPAASETGGRDQPKSVAEIRRFRWATRAEVCNCHDIAVIRELYDHVLHRPNQECDVIK